MMAALRIFIALANQYGYHCHGCDIETTFLHAILTEECYMEIPPGYVRRQGEHENCMRLKKTLYGLKYGPREWNHTLVTFLTEKLGFHQLLSEQSVFTRGSGDQYIAITVHVEDESIISPNEGLIKDLKAPLKIEYGINDLGILSYTLGLEVQWMTNDSVFLFQKKYACTVQTRF